MKVNFSIPVDLFGFRESENSLYSYAKLKIFYVGQTGDKRLFTKKFSDNLLKSLPYVPVVGYYDETDEDFKGHNPEIQNIYGIVPEDTTIEYVEEDGKEYAVCDVILYTGRTDKTGEIAQKIVGKQHSLELNPKNTTYVINRDDNGKTLNIEFKTGTLLGLSILGDGEKPAFSGSEFFNENSHFMEVFEGFKKELEKFTKEKGRRGENMEHDIVLDEVPALSQDNPVKVITNAAEATAEAVNVVTNTEEFLTETGAETAESPTEEKNEEKEKEVKDYKEFLQKFMKQTEQEIQQELIDTFYETFGEYTYPVQWSMAEKELVFYNFEEGEYYRTYFRIENEDFIFGELTEVKMRFLDKDQINQLWPVQEVFMENKTAQKEKTGETEEGFDDKGTEEVKNYSSKNNDGEHVDEETISMKDQEEKESSSAALNSSERAELEAFRREKKQGLIDSFSEDLGKDFLEALKEKVDEFTYDELDIVLAKEFTKVSRKEIKKSQKPNTFVYTADVHTSPTRTQKEIVQDLVNQYKTKN